MGWAKYEEDNYEALADRWTSGNYFGIPSMYNEPKTEYTHYHIWNEAGEDKEERE